MSEDSIRASKLKYYLNNKDKIRAKAKLWAEANPETIKKSQDEYRTLNKELLNVKSKLFREVNKEYYAKKRSDRRVKEVSATPSWVDKEEEFLIQEVFSLAKLRTITTKLKWEVDHIVPLQGKLVCGLHTIGNLQVIPREVNRSKSNSFIDKGV